MDSIPERTVAVRDTVAQELERYFSDPDGDALTWAATSPDTARVTVYVSRDTVLVTALAKGVATVNVTATDVEGLSAAQEFSVIVPNRTPVAVGEIPAEVVEVAGRRHFSCLRISAIPTVTRLSLRPPQRTLPSWSYRSPKGP